MMALAIPVLVWLERKAADPDALRLARMRAALAAEAFCMDSARGWARLADRARGVYEAARS